MKQDILKIFTRFFARVKEHPAAATFGAAALVLGVFVLFWLLWSIGNGSQDAIVRKTSIQPATLVQYIDFDATVAADTDITLAARTGGVITTMAVSEGDIVAKGALIAQLDARAAHAAVAEAQARLAQAEAQLAKLVAGARVEDIRTAQAKVAAAKQAQEGAEAELRVALESLHVALQAALSTIDGYFYDADSDSPRLAFALPAQYALTLENARATLKGALQAVPASDGSLEGEFRQLKQQAQLVRGFLDTAISTLAAAMQHNDALVTTIAPVQDVFIARQQALLQAESTAQFKHTAYTQAADAASVEELAYQRLIADARPEDVAAQVAAVDLAKAALARAQAAYADTIIRAPKDGVVARLFKDVGEYVAPGAPVARLLAQDIYAIVEIPEVDLPLVHRGQDVVVVFDAYPNQEIPATLAMIYPDTIVQGGIVYYRGKVVFDPDTIAALTILPDMSLKVRVPKEKKEVARALEADFVHTDEEGSYIWIETEDGSYIKQPVRIGFRGERFVEILDDIAIGTRVIQNR